MRKNTGVSRRTVLAGAAAVSASSLLAGNAHSELLRLASRAYDASGAIGSDVPRFYHAATAMRDGRILVTGGFHRNPDASNGVHMPSKRVQIYDPYANQWSDAASMRLGRARHASVLLVDGRVAVTGGINGFRLNSVEIYDPARDAWQDGPPMPAAMCDHTACAVGNSIIVLGGPNGNSAHILTIDQASAGSSE